MITTPSLENQLNSSCSGACIEESLYLEQAQQLRGKFIVDEQLQNRIHEVCRHADLTVERQKALNRLLIQLQQLPGIYKSAHQDYSQALNDTWQWVCRSICDFQPRHKSVQQSLVSWINGYLKWRIIDLYIKDNQNVTSLDRPISNDKGEQVTLLDFLPDTQFTSLSLDLLDIKILQLQEGEQQHLGEQIKMHIIQDTQGTLCACHPRKHPECHCQLLAKRLLLQEPPEKISDIAREFEMNNQTLYSHWKQKCLPLLADIGRNCGYIQP